jgi:hypothetical protein
MKRIDFYLKVGGMESDPVDVWWRTNATPTLVMVKDDLYVLLEYLSRYKEYYKLDKNRLDEADAIQEMGAIALIQSTAW